MSEPNIRSALAEHLGAYAEVTSSAAHQWSTQLARRIATFVAVAILVWLALIVGIFVAILASWNTPYRWWVAGGILVVCILGIVAALFGVSVPTAWRWSREGKLPAPTRRGGVATWAVGDLRRALAGGEPTDGTRTASATAAAAAKRTTIQPA